MQVFFLVDTIRVTKADVVFVGSTTANALC